MNRAGRDGFPWPDGRVVPDGKGASGCRPRRVERRLIVVRVESEAMSQLEEPGGGLLVDLGPPVDAYGEDWMVMSHTFSKDHELPGDGRRGGVAGAADAVQMDLVEA